MEQLRTRGVGPQPVLTESRRRYRYWRDAGYVIGALVAGVVADRLGLNWAVGVVAALTLASGLVTLGRMPETRP